MGDVKQVRTGVPIRVDVVDGDQLRRWTIKADYQDPVAERTQASLGFAKDIVGILGGLGIAAPVQRGVASPSGASQWAKELASDAEETQALVRTLLTRANAATQSPLLARIASKRDAIAASLADLDIKLATSASIYAGPPVSYKPPASGIPDVVAVNAGKQLEAARVVAENALSLADHLAQNVRDNAASRGATISLARGYETVTLRMCSRRLSLDNDAITLGPAECSGSTYTVGIANPLGPFWVAAGVVLPFYTSKPTRYALQGNQLVGRERSGVLGGVEPSVLFGLRYVFDDNTALSAGIEGGLGLRSIGSFYTAGANVGLYGVSLGGGIFFDTAGDRSPVVGADSGSVAERTEAKLLIGPYARLAFSSDLWEILGKHAKDLGAKNASAPQSGTPTTPATAPTQPSPPAPQN